MNLKGGVQVFFCALAMYAGAGNAYAQSDECLREAKGKALRWNSRWAEPLVDNNALYIVWRINKDRGTQNTVLDLVASDNTTKGRRKLVVASAEDRRAVCERLTEYRGSLDAKYISQLDIASLPTIRHSQHGWVRSDDIPDSSKLTLCVVFGKPFACITDEKNKFGAELKTVEKDARFSGI